MLYVKPVPDVDILFTFVTVYLSVFSLIFLLSTSFWWNKVIYISDGNIDSNRFTSPTRSYNFRFGTSVSVADCPWILVRNSVRVPSLIGRFLVPFSILIFTVSRHTPRHTDTVITILRYPVGGGVTRAKYKRVQNCNLKNQPHKVLAQPLLNDGFTFIYNPYELSHRSITWPRRIECNLVLFWWIAHH